MMGYRELKIMLAQLQDSVEYREKISALMTIRREPEETDLKTLKRVLEEHDRLKEENRKLRDALNRCCPEVGL